MVLQMNKTVNGQMEKVQSLYDSIKDNPDNALRLMCVDATTKPSASKI